MAASTRRVVLSLAVKPRAFSTIVSNKSMAASAFEHETAMKISKRRANLWSELLHGPKNVVASLCVNTCFATEAHACYFDFPVHVVDVLNYGVEQLVRW